MQEQEAAIRFESPDKQQEFFLRTLSKRVNRYFRDNGLSQYADREMVIKTVAMIGIYGIPYILLLTLGPSFGVALGFWALMGVGVAGIGMSIMHDACHGAYSKNPTVNRLLGYSLNLAGGSTFNWRIQHNKLHHVYPNILGKDEDVGDKLLMTFSPHTEAKGYHKYQPVYAFLFYGILTLYWVLLKDIVQWVKYTRNGENPYKGWRNAWLFGTILMNKGVYFFMILALPVIVGGIPFYQVLMGFLLMHFIAGNILSIVFQLAHIVDGAEHPRPDADGKVRENWAVHQMRTTANFATDNRFINWWTGGLNFQVEHHLFPSICHVHYPKIAPIVRETAREYGIPYMENKSFSDALGSHVRALRKFGAPDLNEVVG